MFFISKNSIEKSRFKTDLSNCHAGAFASFEGWVRQVNDGKDITALEYEVFDELAVKEGNLILKEAKENYLILDAKCVHRSGKLKIGDMAVWVGVTAEHRKDALKACEYIIDAIKMRLPIWKKEHYKIGDSGWINCQPVKGNSQSANEFSNPELQYYSRQMNLPQVGLDGQKKLKDAKVLVVGAGGLGSPALLYLAAGGIGTLGICEFDHLEIHNLHRQPLYSFDKIGQVKSQSAVERLKTLNPFINIKVHDEKLTADNVEKLMAAYDIILDCSDNFKTKFLLNDACYLTKKTLIMASVYQFEGQLKVYRPEKSASCLRCLWPNVPDDSCLDCATAGILGFVPGFFGILQAAEAIKQVLRLDGLASNELLIFDFLSYRMKTLKQVRNPACPVCGEKPILTKIDASHYGDENRFQLQLSHLPLKEFQKFELVDIREPQECATKPVVGVRLKNFPFSQIKESKKLFNRRKEYLVFCEKGIRSNRMVRKLRSEGFGQAFSILGGTDAVNEYIAAHKKDLDSQ